MFTFFWLWRRTHAHRERESTFTSYLSAYYEYNTSTRGSDSSWWEIISVVVCSGRLNFRKLLLDWTKSSFVSHVPPKTPIWSVRVQLAKVLAPTILQPLRYDNIFSPHNCLQPVLYVKAGHATALSHADIEITGSTSQMLAFFHCLVSFYKKSCL